MLKFIVGFIFLAGTLYANTSLLYKVKKGQKDLGYYEINYNDKKDYIKTKTYGVVDKVKFFLNKKIKYINKGHRNIKFTKNKNSVEFDIQTKLKLIDKNIQDKFQRKFKKVKGDDMLLITKKGNKNIELFNKRPTTVLTLEEVLRIALGKEIKKQNIILFDKSGVMKMIAQIVPTKEGFDIINKSKDKKYIKVVIENGLPVLVKSYVSDWSMKIYGAGEFKKQKIDKSVVDTKIKEMIINNLDKKDSATLVGLDNVKKSKKGYLATYTLKFDYPSDVGNKKRYCNKIYKKYSKKGKNIEYNDNSCKVTVKSKFSNKEVVAPFIDQLIKNYPQLKLTKKYKVSKKGSIMYMLIDRVK